MYEPDDIQEALAILLL